MRLRAIITGAAMTVCAGTAANAADIYARAPAPAPSPGPSYVAIPSSWTGFYGGLTAGYGWGTERNNLSANGVDAGGLASNDPNGVLAGGTIGYNYQFLPSFLVGVEADLSWSNMEGKQNLQVYDGHYWQGGWDGLATVRGRAGYVLGKTLIYGTGGYAALHSNEQIVGDIQSESESVRGWRNGWVAGGGLERKFTDHLSAKVEYLHGEFENLSGTTGFPGNMGDQNYQIKSDIDLVRIGLNYKLN